MRHSATTNLTLSLAWISYPTRDHVSARFSVHDKFDVCIHMDLHVWHLNGDRGGEPDGDSDPRRDSRESFRAKFPLQTDGST